jgi:hypothetical protein
MTAISLAAHLSQMSDGPMEVTRANRAPHRLQVHCIVTVMGSIMTASFGARCAVVQAPHYRLT